LGKNDGEECLVGVLRPGHFSQKTWVLVVSERRQDAVMIRAYSQRLLPPFSGVVLIAESDRARAQSFDGLSWEIHYLPGSHQGNGLDRRVPGYAMDRSFIRAAHVQDQQVTPYVLPAHLDSTEVNGCIEELAEFLATAKVPFPAADIYEYWLLDGLDDSPLALILSCCDESQMSTLPARAEWTALPHSKMSVENTAQEQTGNEPPVNHRIQRMVARRSGSTPRAAWFKRRHDDTEDFPALLVREDWQSTPDHEVCQRYLSRKAPRLLMLQGLSQQDRERMEVAAKSYAMEVDQYFPLYPEVNDQHRMSAIRVEARLRRDTPQVTKVESKQKTSPDTAFSKDMRILE